jgi:hypothetical protein
MAVGKAAMALVWPWPPVIGHMHRGSFLAGMHNLDPAADQGIENRHDMIA